MNTKRLLYIDSKYVLDFEVQSDLELYTQDKGFNAKNFMTLLQKSVGMFGKGVDVPQSFFEMTDEDFDAFLIKVETRLPSLMNRFYVEVDEKEAATFVSNDNTSLFRVAGYNEHFMALQAKESDEFIWGLQELVMQSYTRVAKAIQE